MRILVGLVAAGYGVFKLTRLLRSGEEPERAKVWGNILLIGAGVVLVAAEVALIVMN